jgi:CRISPR system Cascade subunit CasE
MLGGAFIRRNYSVADEPLFIVRAEFLESALFRFAAATGLALRVADGGYIMHAALSALFGDAAPKPFTIASHHGDRRVLLGYSVTDHANLVERARALADPLILDAIDLNSLCSKRMPIQWRARSVFRFTARCCPVVRISGRSHNEAPREADAFLHRCWRSGEAVSVDREHVYREWLQAQLGRDGAASLLYANLVRFQRTRLSRRDRGGVESKLIRNEKPDATLEGHLRVENPQAFANLLRRGLGRHRAFGFGMLMLRH